MTILLLAEAAETAANSSYLAWGIILFAVALVLFVVELFIPTGGVLALLCGVAAIASVVSFFRYDTAFGVGALLAYIILGPFVTYFGLKLWMHSPIANRMVLGGSKQVLGKTAEEAYLESERERGDRLAQLRALIGAEGTAVTDLRPVGVVRIEGQRIDAMAEMGLITRGTPIVVVEAYDNQVKVRPIES